MKLSDFVSSLDLAIWPSIAMVIFLAVFVSVVLRTYTRPKGELARIASLPTDDGRAVAPAGGQPVGGGANP